MTFRNWRFVLAPVAVFAGGLLLVSGASASVMGTLVTGSSGTVTVSMTSAVFNVDSAANGGGNSDVSGGVGGTALKFAGCSGVLGSPGCLSVQEGVTVNNNDLTLVAPSLADANTFLTFASHPNLVYSINWPPGPGSANTNCSTANANGLSCSVFAGSPIILTYSNGETSVTISTIGKASDTGVAGLATGSSYIGGFSEILTALPNGMAPTPQNVQLYYCPDFVSNGNSCSNADFTSGRAITTGQTGSFTATPVPESSSTVLSSIGILMLLVGRQLRRVFKTHA